MQKRPHTTTFTVEFSWIRSTLFITFGLFFTLWLYPYLYSDVRW